MLATPVMRIHEINKYSLQKIYFRNRMRKQDIQEPVVYTSKVLIVEKYGKLREGDQTITLWTEPKGVTNSQEITIPSDYQKEVFKITELASLGTEVYAKLTLDKVGFVGYINQEYLTWLDEDQCMEVDNQINEKNEMMIPKLDLAKFPVPEFDDQKFNFVHMGRLSPEKNQEALIRAFYKYHKEYPNSRLYILGKGPLKSLLVQLVQELELEGIVILLGHIQNPYRFMEKADCFVLPSLYEGQPMVLLEALTLGMSVLASNIPANINVLHEDERYGLMTEGIAIDDIYNGLIRITQYDGTFAKFDYEEYNQAAIQSFYNEIE